MTHFNRLLKSDFLKIKKTPLPLLHILLPLLGASIFLLFYTVSPRNALLEISGYLQVLACVFPVLISVICSIISEQEFSAGNFQEILTASAPKSLSFLSKLFLLFILGFFSTLLATGLFGIGFSKLLNHHIFKIDFYLASASILIISNLFLYICHLFIALQFGSSVSIIVGIIESLISALLATGLGDDIWIFIPCGWGIRFSSIWVLYTTDSPQNLNSLLPLCHGIILCIFAIFIVLSLSCIWFYQWEGRKQAN